MAVDDFVTDSVNRTNCENKLKNAGCWDENKAQISELKSEKLAQTSEAMTYLGDAKLLSEQANVDAVLSATNLQETNLLLGTAHEKGLLSGDKAQVNLDRIFEHPQPRAVAESTYKLDNVSQEVFEALDKQHRTPAIQTSPMSDTSKYRGELEQMRADANNKEADQDEDTTPSAGSP